MINLLFTCAGVDKQIPSFATPPRQPAWRDRGPLVSLPMDVTRRNLEIDLNAGQEEDKADEVAPVQDSSLQENPE